MNEDINESNYDEFLPGPVLAEEPRGAECQKVMLQMKQTDLTIFFPQHKEDRVYQVNQFIECKIPKCSEDLIVYFSLFLF